MGQPCPCVQTGGRRGGVQLWESDVGVLADVGLSMSQQFTLTAKRANSPLGCIRASPDGRWVREGIVPLCSVLVQPHLKHWVQFGCTVSEGHQTSGTAVGQVTVLVLSFRIPTPRSEGTKAAAAAALVGGGGSAQGKWLG